jgi:hypothetical protein
MIFSMYHCTCGRDILPVVWLLWTISRCILRIPVFPALREPLTAGYAVEDGKQPESGLVLASSLYWVGYLAHFCLLLKTPRLFKLNQIAIRGM